MTNMPLRIFFSFDFGKDAWRVSQVRNSNVFRSKYEKNTILDKTDWEKIKSSGDDAIKKWIDKELDGTSVNIVLIGAQTSVKPWVKYEIGKSWNKGIGVMGIYIHNLKNEHGLTDLKGNNPFDSFHMTNSITYKLSNYVKTYDWVSDNGQENIDNWIENAVEDRIRISNWVRDNT